MSVCSQPPAIVAHATPFRADTAVGESRSLGLNGCDRLLAQRFRMHNLLQRGRANRRVSVAALTLVVLAPGIHNCIDSDRERVRRPTRNLHAVDDRLFQLVCGFSILQMAFGLRAAVPCKRGHRRMQPGWRLAGLRCVRAPVDHWCHDPSYTQAPTPSAPMCAPNRKPQCSRDRY